MPAGAASSCLRQAESGQPPRVRFYTGQATVSGGGRGELPVSLLNGIRTPADLRRLSRAELGVLAKEIREFLVDSVSRTVGHLGPNLGVGELTIALHRVFDSPRDRLVRSEERRVGAAPAPPVWPPRARDAR